MKLSIVLYGIYNAKCSAPLNDNILNPLKKIFKHINFYIITYYNFKVIDIINEYKPKDMILLPNINININNYDDDYYLSSIFEKAFEITDNDEYDYLLLTRLDLFFYKQIHFTHIYENKCIFGSHDTMTRCDNNFIMCHKKYVTHIYTYIKSKRYLKWLNKVIGEDNINYIIKDIQIYNNLSNFYII